MMPEQNSETRSKLRRSLPFAGGLAFALFPVFQRFVLLPFYEANSGSDLFALVNRTASMVVLPGKTIAYNVWPPQHHYFTNGLLLLAAVLNCVLFTLLAAFVMFAWRQLRAGARPDEAAPADTQRKENPNPVSRRAFLAASLAGGAGMCAAFGSSVAVQPNHLRLRELSVPIKGLPQELDGLRLAHLTDIHHGEWISLEQVRHAVAMANAAEPDMMLLTGDYVTASAKYIEPVAAELAALKPKIGTLAVLGNHDWWTDADETRRAFGKHGIPLIDNGRRFLSVSRRLQTDAAPGLCIAGVGDAWVGEVNLAEALAGVPDDTPRIVLSHNPDAAEMAMFRPDSPYRVDLMLSGHTHGGQVRLPLLGTPIVPSQHGSKYARGLVRAPGCLVYVSSGIGMAMLPVRFGVPPEIAVITLKAEG